MMHRDKVIGLALSILLVGIVAAFFFRPNSKDEAPPQLANPEQLNSRISERPRTPYLTSPEFHEPKPTSETARAVSAARPVQPPVVDPGWELPDFLKDDSEIAAPLPTHEPFPLNAAPPDPIQITETEDEDAPIAIPIPRHNDGWEVEEIAPQTAQHAVSPKPQMHVVTQGDTLSELAYKYLGTSTRFLEIYDANRDQLKSPNDLRVGMTIRIPAIRQAQDSTRDLGPHNARRDQSIDTKPVSRETEPISRDTKPETRATNAASREAGPQPAVPNDDDDPFDIRPEGQSTTRPFVPVRRSPLNPARRDGLSLENEHPAAVRSLTQIPPIDLPVLDEDVFAVEAKPPGLPSVAERPDGSLSEVKDRSREEPKPEPRVAASKNVGTSNQLRASAASQQSLRKYEVRRGDSLEDIAVRFYGTRMAAGRIYEANRNRLRSPNAIRAGMTLLLP